MGSNIDDQSDDIGHIESKLDGIAVMDGLATEIVARDVTISVAEVRMETRKKIVTFHNCVNELLKLAEKYGNSAVDAMTRVLLAAEDEKRFLKKKKKIENIRMMNLNVELVSF